MTTSKTIRGLVAAAATALLVTGCATSSDTEAPEVTTSTSTTTSSPTSSTTTTPPTTSETPEPEPAPVVPEPAAAPAPVAPVYTPPTFLYCYLADGTAMMSDGTTTYMDSCNESAGGPPVLEDGTSIYDNMPLEVWEGTEWEGTGPPPGYYN